MTVIQEATRSIIEYLFRVQPWMHVLAAVANFLLIPTILSMINILYSSMSKDGENGIHCLMNLNFFAILIVALRYFISSLMIGFGYKSYFSEIEFYQYLIQFLLYAIIIITSNNLTKENLNNFTEDTGSLLYFFRSKTRRLISVNCVLAFEASTLFFVPSNYIDTCVCLFLIMNGLLMLIPLRTVVKSHLMENYSRINRTAIENQKVCDIVNPSD